MGNVRDLHIKRLNDGCNRISEFRSGNYTAHDVEFSSWKDRVQQNLNHLFGNKHDYARRFSYLQFWDLRATIDLVGGQSWSQEDKQIFDSDLHKAEQILTDALEELDFTPEQPEQPQQTQSTEKTPTIVINVHNVLSQTSNIQMTQLLASLDNLGLTPDQKELAEKHAKEFAAEAQGEQRWPMLAKSLDALKSLGKSAYEHVAIPLLLEMLKKQTGIND